jgi:Protein of unknown function (DUF2852)
MNPVLWLDDIGKPAWIALMVVSFILFWPAGLVVLGYLIGSGRMFGCWTGEAGGRWQGRMQRMQDRVDRMQARAARWCGPRQAYGGGLSSGNWAFDEYRTDTLRRLEEEQRQFKEFLDRLRHAKDKAEFDQFMAEMRRRPEGGAPSPPEG